MDFSNKDKLLVTLLTDIHKALKIKDSVDPDFVQRMAVGGQGWALEWKYPGVFEETNDDPEEVKYVSDVLEMWSVLECSFNSLDVAQRACLTAAAGSFGKNVSFPGFDGNHEHQYLSIAKIFVDDLDRWSEFSGRILNSHMRTTDSYQRMLEVFDGIRYRKTSEGDFGMFGVEDLAEVLNGRTHPSNR